VKRRRVIAIAALAAAGLAAWDLQRRRDLRAIAADPEWQELNRTLNGRTLDVGSADGTRLHVEIFGADDRPAVLLIHGWLEAIRLWHYQIRELSKDHRVIAYDLRGHGLSGPARDRGYTEAGLADDVDAVLNAVLGDGERCVVAGHSMGAMSVVAWSGLHPDAVRRRLAGAALVSTGMSEMLAHLAVLGARGGLRLHATLLPPVFLSSLHVPNRIEPLTLRLVKRWALSRNASPGRVAFCSEMFLSAAPLVRASFARLLMELDLMPSLQHLVVPTAIIAGQEDRLLPPWHSQQLAATLPEVVDYVELPGVGHMAPIEAPDEVTRRLLRLSQSHLVEQEPALAR
jgi:pimeloyl-ACP methyl ester carboxylesterase